MPDMCKSTSRYTEYCLGIELNGQSLETGDSIGARRGAIDSAIERIRNVEP